MNKTRGQQEAESALEYLRLRGVEHFVHFTALDNIQSILEHGIMPRAMLDCKSANYLANDNLRLDGPNHVNLSITHPNTKLFYKFRMDNPDRYYVVLQINPEILLSFTGDNNSERYSFRSTNAASSFAAPCNIEQLFSGQRPEGYKDEWTTDPQAEVLIPGIIPADYIEGILLPSNYDENAERVDLLKSIESKIVDLELSCKLQVCGIIFDNLRQKLMSASITEKFELYYLSWQTTEENHNLLESEVEKIPHKSHFGSIAVPISDIMNAGAYYRNPEHWVEWSLEFHKPKNIKSRSNEELSALAVIEKIINRSSVGVLSGTLEQHLYNAVFSSDEVRLNDEKWMSIFRNLVSRTHQIQCSIIELIKHQRLNKDFKLQFLEDCNISSNLSLVAQAAISDLILLSNLVCKLYGCSNILEGISIINENEKPDFTIVYNSSGTLEDIHEAHISSYVNITSHCYYDPIQIQSSVSTHPSPIVLRGLLEYIFRFEDFREGQYPALARALSREDTIVLLPTGSGKSIIFQLLALITPGTAFIVAPITSLIDDQVQNLEERGINRIIGLTSKTKDKRTLERRLATGQYLMCYVSPERFQIQTFINSVQNYARENLVSVVAIDEAHCVSEWGHDFRTSYLGLARNCRNICSTNGEIPPLLALTGTASTSVLMDMRNDLEIKSANAIIKPKTFDRSELHYRVLTVKSEGKLDALNEIMNVYLPKDTGVATEALYTHTGDENTMSGIVFCQNANGNYGLMNSAKALEFGHPGVWDFLNEKYPNEVAYYCGSRPKRLRSMSESEWTNDKAQQALNFKNNIASIMVATKAFGMGIDKPNVRWVVHFGMPGSLESYYQEVGRAARDKNDSYVYLILSDDYPELNDALLDPTSSDLQRMNNLENTKEEFKGDDVSRCIHFHKTTFIGIDDELRIAKNIFEMCGRQNYYDKRWHIPFINSKDDSTKDGKNAMERAVYRLTLLGAFKGYTIEYTNPYGGEFLIEPVQANGQELREIVKENYLSYIESYQSDAAFLSMSRQSLEGVVEGIENDRDFILQALKHLLTNFTYKVIEEGRRRAIITMLEAARRTSEISDVDKAESYLRKQIINYLSTGSDEDEQIGLASILHDATDIDKLLRVIEVAIKQKQEEPILQQALRLLEDYPQHYGFYYVAAALQACLALKNESIKSMRSMVHFGSENYGIDKNQSANNYMKYLKSSHASKISIEIIDKSLMLLCELTEITYNELLGQLPNEKKRMIMSLKSLAAILSKVEKDMKWKIPNMSK